MAVGSLDNITFDKSQSQWHLSSRASSRTREPLNPKCICANQKRAIRNGWRHSGERCEAYEMIQRDMHKQEKNCAPASALRIKILRLVFHPSKPGIYHRAMIQHRAIRWMAKCSIKVSGARASRKQRRSVNLKQQASDSWL